ncbi:MAG: cation:proton antiporter [Candidatus Woesearchaeota archaeon]
MDVVIVFSVIGAILVLGFLAEILFRKTGIPDVTLLMFIGIALNLFFFPEGFELHGIAEVFTTFALIYILFQGSLNIHFQTIIKSMSKTLMLTFSSFILTIVGTTIVMYYLGFDIILGILLGAIIGGASSTVVIPLLKYVNVDEKTKSYLTLESAINDVLCVVVSLAILQLIVTGELVATGIFQTLLLSLSVGIFLGSIAALLWILLMYRFKSLSQAYMLTIGIIILLYAFVESDLVGANGAIACLAFGLVLGNSRLLLAHVHARTVRNLLTPSALTFFSEISFFLKVTFFVYLGLIIDFSNWQTIVLGLLLTIAIFITRPALIRIIFGKDIKDFDRTLLEVVIPKGLAAAVLAQFAGATLITHPTYQYIALELANIAFAVVFFSMVFTSLLVFLAKNEKFHGLYHKEAKEQEKPKAHTNHTN